MNLISTFVVTLKLLKIKSKYNYKSEFNQNQVPPVGPAVICSNIMPHREAGLDVCLT
jgi:hypothetical protein